MTRKINSLLLVCCVFLSFLFIFLTIPLNNMITYADDESTISYSDVLEDLHKDENFSEKDFPLIENVTSLQVIQIAESENNELFIYVYQSGGIDFVSVNNLYATSINISLLTDSLSYRNYALTLVSENGVFFKYRVENLYVQNTGIRQYDISSIFRAWNENFDEDVPAYSDNTIDEVSYSVAKLYTAVTDDNGQVHYDCQSTQVVEVTEKYVGFYRYTTAINWSGKACDSHFVAFSTDYDIDRLFEVDISYVYKTYKMTDDTGIFNPSQITFPTYEYGEEQQVIDTLYSDETTEVQVGLFFKTEYSWKQIETVAEFMDGKNLSDTAKRNLNGKQWVLNFFASDYQKWADSIGVVAVTKYETGTRVKEVTLLRLKFETDGEVYNLGVVDNKQSGSMTPTNNPIQLTWFQRLIGTILLILLIFLLLPLLPTILSVLGTIIKAIFQVVWFLVSLPFKLIKSLFSKRGKK